MKSSFQVFVTNAYFHMHIYISEFVIPLYRRYQVVPSCTFKEYSKDMQFLATSPYYNTTTYNSCESLKEHILDCITSHNRKEDIFKSSSLMVGTIFNLAKVNVLCMFTVALSLLDSGYTTG